MNPCQPGRSGRLFDINVPRWRATATGARADLIRVGRHVPDVTPERWVPVVGYEGLYEVSDLGRVRSLPRLSCRGQVLKPSLSPLGYRRVHLCDRGRDRLRFIHLIVAEAFIGPCPDGWQVRHLDGNALNNLLSNLAYCTPSENVLDQVRHGTHTWASRTHCKWGHEFTPENTHVYREAHGGLGRDCRQCRRERRQRKAA